LFKEARLSQAYNKATVYISDIDGNINNETQSEQLAFDVLIQVIDDPFNSSGISGKLEITCLSAIDVLQIRIIGPILRPVLHIFKTVQV